MKRKRLARDWNRSLVLVPVCVFALATVGDAAEMTDCLRQARNLPAAIQSIDYSYTTNSGRSLINGRFVIQGDRWYHGLFEKPGDEIADTEFAFNGAKYEHKKSGTYLRFSDKPLSSVAKNGPLVHPYVWFISQPPELSLDALQDQEKWEEVIKQLKSEGKKDVDGKECEAYSLVRDKGVFTVYLSLVDHGFPILVQFDGNDGLKAECRATELAEFPGPVVVAVRLEGSNTSLRTQYEIEKATLKVNQPADPTIFSLDPTGVPQILQVKKSQD